MAISRELLAGTSGSIAETSSMTKGTSWEKSQALLSNPTPPAGSTSAVSGSLPPDANTAQAAGGAPTKALTYDQGKPPLAVLPWAAIRELAKVQAYGHQKYKDFNNYRKGMEVSRNLSCSLRHIADYMDGHDADLESGINPLSHALCRIAFVLQNIHDGTAIDDRYKPNVQPK